ncbi:hypothetical protein M758_3G130900 [Ceratodon purpureus]|nr:hypothetical protein M758_3G130900 [Ceratodon purpureus]KAG0622879.1 hypothetical protein M758_3G130900 [Ceratodon purpureus]
MAKKALLVGCNYPGTKVELHGCANDAKRMYKTLISRFGFDESDILVLLDTDESGMQPTGANIRSSLAKMIRGVEPGDVLVFHYSGHGTQVPAEGGALDETGAEEAIVPTDMNLLTDDDFREVVNQIPPGATFTFISDSCHSGGLIDSAKEQIGGSSALFSGGAHSHGFAGLGDVGGDGGFMGLVSQGLQSFGNRDLQSRDFHFSHDSIENRIEERVNRYRREGDGEPQEESYERHGGRRSEWGDPAEGHGGRGRDQYEEYSHPVKSREIPIAMLTQILGERTGHKVDVGNIRTTLFDMFGDDASPTVKMFAKMALEQLRKRGGNQEGVMGAVSSLATQFLAAKLEGEDSEQAAHYGAPAENAAHYRPRPRRGGRSLDVGILLSGCQPNETSADAKPAHGESYGAFSNAIQAVLSETDAALSNRELVLQVRKKLESQGFKQHPCLYCADDKADAVFIGN